MKLIALTIIFSFFLFGCNQKKETGKQKADLKYVFIERYPLPFPPEVTDQKYTNDIDSLLQERDSIQEELSDMAIESVDIIDKKEKIDELNQQFDLNTGKIVKLQNESICHAHDDSQPVELYDGSLGVSKAFVERISKSVGQLQWKYSFGNEFNGAGNNEGNVKGARWCTGTLISKNIFITAGHCFSRKNGSGWKLPSKNGQIISSDEIAGLMKVNFNYQLDKLTGRIRADTIDYPVDSLIEYQNGHLDYAIIILGKDKDGKYPGERFGFIEVSKSSPSQNDLVAIVQHPLGKPKVVEAGKIFSITPDLINYDDIDTQGGSSGSAVISSVNNRIVGIHVLGGCDNDEDGSNHATPIFLIIKHSAIIKSLAK